MWHSFYMTNVIVANKNVLLSDRRELKLVTFPWYRICLMRCLLLVKGSSFQTPAIPHLALRYYKIVRDLASMLKNYNDVETKYEHAQKT